MAKDEIQNIAKNSLSDLLQEPGGILYSSHETLKPASVYLLGFNPGGSDGAPLGESLKSMLSYCENAYVNESWINGNGEWGPGEAPLQKRVRWLLNELGLETSAVCASNLIFFQSRSAADIDFSLAKRCWPVHEGILKIVRPKLIIAFGNSDKSPYGYLHEMFRGEEESISSGHGNWKVKGFHCRINDRPVYVAGLPHLSRYSPVGKRDVVQWLAQHL
jgi:hypothetical protein